MTYWMNMLQTLPKASPLFVTLNPVRAPDPAKVIRAEIYEHPLFDAAAMRAQRELWSLQGEAQHLVVRRLFRGRLPRGRAAGGAGGGRGAGRREAALDRGRGIGPHPSGPAPAGRAAPGERGMSRLASASMGRRDPPAPGAQAPSPALLDVPDAAGPGRDAGLVPPPAPLFAQPLQPLQLP